MGRHREPFLFSSRRPKVNSGPRKPLNGWEKPVQMSGSGGPERGEVSCASVSLLGAVLWSWVEPGPGLPERCLVVGVLTSLCNSLQDCGHVWAAGSPG